jgi:hypothetical protein
MKTILGAFAFAPTCALALLAGGGLGSPWNVSDDSAPQSARIVRHSPPLYGTRVTTRLPVYDAQEPIVVDYAGFPGEEGDWITVVRRTRPDNEYAEWHYLGERQEGTLTFSGLPPGEYEVRGYFDWPDGGYEVKARSILVIR